MGYVIRLKQTRSSNILTRNIVEISIFQIK